MGQPSKKILAELILMATIAIGQAHADTSIKTTDSLKDRVPTASSSLKNKAASNKSNISNTVKKNNVLPSDRIKKGLGQKALGNQNNGMLNQAKELNGFQRLNPTDAIKQPGSSQPMRRGNVNSRGEMTQQTPHDGRIGGDTATSSSGFNNGSKTGSGHTVINPSIKGNVTPPPSSPMSQPATSGTNTNSHKARRFNGVGDNPDHFQLPNGDNAPANDRNGGAGVPNNRGGVDYPDGTSMNGAAASPTTVTNPDGSESQYAERFTTTDVATGNSRETFRLSNGQLIEDNGSIDRKADGSLVNRDTGEMVRVDPATGDTVVIGSNGVERSRSPSPLAQGSSIERIEPSGNHYGEGSDMRGGTRIHHGVGDTADTATLSNGEVIILKEGMIVASDGAVLNPMTGEVIKVDPVTGATSSSHEGYTPGASHGPDTKDPTDNTDSDDGDSGGDDGDSDSDDGDSDSDDGDSGDDSGGDSGGDSGDDDGGDDADSGKEGAAEYREGGNSYNRAPGAKIVDDFVGKKTGENKDVEATNPEPCGEGDNSGRVAQPGPENGSNCLPGNMGSGDGEEGPTAPRVEDNIPTTPTGTRGSSQVINPTGVEERFNETNNALDTLEAIEQTVNPDSR
jgi:hypothetical protein